MSKCSVKRPPVLSWALIWVAVLCSSDTSLKSRSNNSASLAHSLHRITIIIHIISKTPLHFFCQVCWKSNLLSAWHLLMFPQGFRHSPRHARRSIHARVAEEKPNLVEIPESEPDSSSTLRKRKVKKRVPPEFYQSVQVTPTRRPVGTRLNCDHD